MPWQGQVGKCANIWSTPASRNRTYRNRVIPPFTPSLPIPTPGEPQQSPGRGLRFCACRYYQLCDPGQVTSVLWAWHFTFLTCENVIMTFFCDNDANRMKLCLEWVSSQSIQTSNKCCHSPQRTQEELSWLGSECMQSAIIRKQPKKNCHAREKQLKCQGNP